MSKLLIILLIFQLGSCASSKKESVSLETHHPAEIQTLLRKNLGKLNDCYHKIIPEKSRVKPLKAVSEFIIDKEGRVEKVHFSFSQKGLNKVLSSCLSKVIKEIPFSKPPHDGYAEVKQQFIFK